jgi:hypothetical protein
LPSDRCYSSGFAAKALYQRVFNVVTNHDGTGTSEVVQHAPLIQKTEVLIGMIRRRRRRNANQWAISTTALSYDLSDEIMREGL